MCSGTNELRGGNAEMVNDLSHWMVVGNASIQTVNSELVFNYYIFDTVTVEFYNISFNKFRGQMTKQFSGF